MAKGKMVVSQGKLGRRRRPTRKKKWKNCAPQARPKGEKDKNGAPQARPKGENEENGAPQARPKEKMKKWARRRRAPGGNEENGARRRRAPKKKGPEGPFPTENTLEIARIFEKSQGHFWSIISDFFWPAKKTNEKYK